MTLFWSVTEPEVDVPVTVRVYVPGGVPLVGGGAPPPPQAVIAAVAITRLSAAARIQVRPRATLATPSMIARQSALITQSPVCGW
jgi:hypothetical protein